jgi:hypothetical protein
MHAACAVTVCVVPHSEAAQPGVHSAWQLLVCPGRVSLSGSTRGHVLHPDTLLGML